MIARSIRTYSQCLDFIKQRANGIFASARIPVIPVTPDKSPMPAGHRARFIWPNLRIEISRQLIDLVADQDDKARVWNALSAIRHEICHYQQYLRGVRKFTRSHEDEALLIGRMYADEAIRRMSKEEINPTKGLSTKKYLIACSKCNSIFSLDKGKHLSYCPKCKYQSNPILADLGASALAGFGLAAGWKGFEWALKKVRGKKSKAVAHKVASSNPAWQIVKRSSTGEATQWEKPDAVIFIRRSGKLKAIGLKGKRYVAKVGSTEYGALTLTAAMNWADNMLGKNPWTYPWHKERR